MSEEQKFKVEAELDGLKENVIIRATFPPGYEQRSAEFRIDYEVRSGPHVLHQAQDHEETFLVSGSERTWTWPVKIKCLIRGGPSL
jgi:hypothetical protein